jgi:hypothetical protein
MSVVAESGTCTTKPLVLEGRELNLNLNAKGAVKVAIVDQGQKPVLGFDLSDCDAIKGEPEGICTNQIPLALGRVAR